MVVWVVVVAGIALTSTSGRQVYWISALLCAPLVALSQVEHGLLPLAGIIHMFAAGLYPGLLHWAIASFRRGRQLNSTSRSP